MENNISDIDIDDVTITTGSTIPLVEANDVSSNSFIETFLT